MATVKGWWAFAWIGTCCIVAALIMQTITLSWRNWLQLDFAVVNHTSQQMQIGLWGACVTGVECYSFHGEGLPWHLQATIFLAMISVCFQALILCLCIVELLYLWNSKGFFPLKQSQLYLALVTVVVALGMAVVSGLLTLSGMERDVWKIVNEKMNMAEPGSTTLVGRFSVSQAWGYQILVSVCIVCFIVVTKSQLNKMSAAQAGERSTNQRCIEVVLVTPPPAFRAPNLQLQHTPPPAYSPPPAYQCPFQLDEAETPFIVHTAHEDSVPFGAARSGAADDTVNLLV